MGRLAGLSTELSIRYARSRGTRRTVTFASAAEQKAARREAKGRQLGISQSCREPDDRGGIAGQTAMDGNWLASSVLQHAIDDQGAEHNE